LKPALARFAYSTLLRLATPLYFARLRWRGRKERGYRRHWRERLALAGPQAEAGAVWIHAVSLGETRAADALLHALREIEPGLRLLLTHGTATGRKAGKLLLREGDTQVWLPYDTPGAVRRFLRRHRPRVGVLMETEVWPNLLHAARREGVPMVLANARLSDKSAAKGVRFSALLQPAAQNLSLVLAQTDGDAWRMGQLGVPNVQVAGNLKFDMTPNPKLVARGLQWRETLARPVVLAASTREGEEAALLSAWAALRPPRPLLLVVPRHPQRFDEVARLVAEQGLTLARRSTFADVPPEGAGSADVWLGDSLGEMPLYYGCADVALLGGSFAPLGGQNLIEAAACGCPLVMGPHTFNFEEAAELALKAGAGLRVTDIGAGIDRAIELAGSATRNDWVQHALRFAGAHRGAAERMAREILAVASPA
jgi:3-deoxy-D-manno-octulosonic-acid transferase